MNEEEFKTKVTIEEQSIIYKIQTYRHYDDGIGNCYDFKELEFNKLERADAAIKSYTSNGPEYKGEIISTKKEYLIYDKHHTIKYRTDLPPTPAAGFIHIYSVDGYKIASDKCAYECKQCGAIWKSKAISGYSMFPTDDPRCKTEIHPKMIKEAEEEYAENNLKKICICEDLDQRYEQIDREWRALEEANK